MEMYEYIGWGALYLVILIVILCGIAEYVADRKELKQENSDG